jgi:integrase
MASVDEEDDDFEKLMEEIDLEAYEAAEAYFNDLYETAHGTSATSSLSDVFTSDFQSSEDEKEFFAGGLAYEDLEQRKGGLRWKLDACPEGEFAVTYFSAYNHPRWVLKEGGEFTEVAIPFSNVRDDLQPLKRAISYYFLPSNDPFGTIRSFISSWNYSDAFKYIQSYVFEANRLSGTAQCVAVIDAGMLNAGLDCCKEQGSPRAYNMMFFYVNFWLVLSSQKLLPDDFCLDVDVALVDTKVRRMDVLESIKEAFVGWKPYTEEELGRLLDYAFFWVDDAIPVIKNIQDYLISNPSGFRKFHSRLSCSDELFESVLSQRVRGVEIVGFRRTPQVTKRKRAPGKISVYRGYKYTWRRMYQYSIDRVRNAVFILFCLMTGMRKRELAALKFEDVVKGKDGLWRVFFARYKTSSDPNYSGDSDSITIPDYLGDAIQDYQKLRTFDDNFGKGYLFQSALSNLEVNRVDKMILRVGFNVARETGVPQLHLHRFRKTIAELLINESEANIDVIRMIFGHSSYLMTLRYIARNPFLVSSVVETLKEHFAEDFVDVVRAIHTGVYAGDAAHRIAEQMQNRPELFSGTVLKTTVMQYVQHLFEGGSTFYIQRTSLDTICMSQPIHESDELPPCLILNKKLIYPVKPDFSNCHISCSKNVVLQKSKSAIEHNIRFYKTVLVNRARLKPDVIKQLENKVAVNERLLEELIVSASNQPISLPADKI